MNHEEFLKFHKDCCDKMHAICRAKNHDYSGKTGHAFENFTVVENAGITSAEQGFLVRMMDKFMRVSNFTKTGVLAVADEKIEDTLLDLANYAILLAGYIRFKKANAEGDGSSKKRTRALPPPTAIPSSGASTT